MRISQRPATNEFCDTGTGTPIQGMCQVPIIIQPGGVILAPGVYNLASFTNSPLSTNGNVLNGNTGTSTIVVAPQSLTISATLQLEGNTVATWDGGGTNPTLPIYLNAEFWVFYDDNDFPPSLPAGVTMSIGGTWLTISTGPQSTITIGGQTYSNSSGTESAFIGLATINRTVPTNPPNVTPGRGSTIAYNDITLANSRAVTQVINYSNPSTYAPLFSVSFSMVFSFINGPPPPLNNTAWDYARTQGYINGSPFGPQILTQIPSTSTGFDIGPLNFYSDATGYNSTLGVLNIS
jgi:hypothetical protein